MIKSCIKSPKFEGCFSDPKGSFIIYEVGGGIYTKVVANVANHLDKTYVMVHDDECEGKN